MDHLYHGPLRRAEKQGTSTKGTKKKPQIQRARDKMKVKAENQEFNIGQREQKQFSDTQEVRSSACARNNLGCGCTHYFAGQGR